MKTKLTIILIFAAFLSAYTQNNSGLVKITGKITNPVCESVSFKSLDTAYSTSVNNNGTFEITFFLDSAQYIYFKHGNENTAMYIKPGDNINLSIDTRFFDETIKYQGSPASDFLARKYLFNETTDFFGEEYYFGSIGEYESVLKKYKLSLFEMLEKLNDSSFIIYEKNEIEKDFTEYVNRKNEFEKWESGYGKDVRQYHMLRDKLSNKYEFVNAIYSLNGSEFSNLVNQYYDSLNYLLSKVTDTIFIRKVRQNNEEYKLQLLDRKINTDKMPKVGEPAIDFTFSDKDGNNISLSSLKGKLVYVDVWATWCGPCVGEIPALQNLEEEYHDKNVYFVSISIDFDKDQWLKMLNEKGLGGIQLWGGSSPISNAVKGFKKDYAIYTIPRFMLFSEDGIIISTDAPRPSSAEIKSILDSNL